MELSDSANGSKPQPANIVTGSGGNNKKRSQNAGNRGRNNSSNQSNANGRKETNGGRAAGTGTGTSTGSAKPNDRKGPPPRGPVKTENSVNKRRQNQAPLTAEEKRRRRETKREGRRAAQQAAVQKKADAEDQYFLQCKKEAAEQKKKGPSPAQVKKREAELFSKQGAHGINFAKYDEIKVEVKKGTNNKETAEKQTFSDYDELSLNPTVRRNIALMNYKRPTPIQKHAIPLALAGDDLMCCAQTGSGKTCAFLLPVIASMENQQHQKNKQQQQPTSGNSHGVAPRCVILAPTRELASQIELEAQKFLHQMHNLRAVVVYGGASQRQQIRELAFGADIVVATPGRLTDFVDRSLIVLDQVQFLVLDEADRMLDMGFEPQIRRIVLQSGMTPKERRQTFMFSATFPDKIQLLAREFLRAYTWIAVGRVGSTTDSITQVLLKATEDKRHKMRLVVEAVQSGPDGRTLIFVQKKRTATWLKKQLCKGGPENGGEEDRFTPIKATDIHGDRSQAQREKALASFRSGDCRVLVATDVAARGLDIGGVEHVINMDLPVAGEEFDSYVHRIGRTGRAGHAGLATSLYVPGDAPKTGNKKIAALLIQQLKESSQEIPPWLEDEIAGGGGGATNSNPKQKFGGTDVRQNNGGRGRNGGGSRRDMESRGGRGGGRGGGGTGRGGGGGRTGRGGGRRGGGGRTDGGRTGGGGTGGGRTGGGRTDGGRTGGGRGRGRGRPAS